MSVTVNDDMSLDLAMSMLWREVNRENLPDIITERRYRVRPTSVRHEQRKYWAKQKKRRSAANRKLRRKGIGI